MTPNVLFSRIWAVVSSKLSAHLVQRRSRRKVAFAIGQIIRPQTDHPLTAPKDQVLEYWEYVARSLCCVEVQRVQHQKTDTLQETARTKAHLGMQGERAIASSGYKMVQFFLQVGPSSHLALFQRKQLPLRSQNYCAQSMGAVIPSTDIGIL